MMKRYFYFLAVFCCACSFLSARNHNNLYDRNKRRIDTQENGCSASHPYNKYKRIPVEIDSVEEEDAECKTQFFYLS